MPDIATALIQPAAYSHPTGRIQHIQTHISHVFLAGDYAYKIKKPVDFGFLNYSTLTRRRYYCHQELKLNRQLCDDVYLGVVPIRELDGSLHVNGKHGKIVEYAVWMRRVPHERMLDQLIAAGKATKRMVEMVAARLVPFHRTAETSPAIAHYGDWAIRYNHRENIGQWTPFVGRTLSEEKHRALLAYADAYFARKADILARRVKELRVRRVHADLRADAVLVGDDGVCIMDCVEFNRRINVLDVARDVGFFDMDLKYRGRPDLAAAFIRAYQGSANDPDLAEILPFYAYYSACVRGKVENFLLDIPGLPVAQKRAAAKRASQYWDLALNYAKTLPPALLVITCGLSGTGKSTVANDLAREIGAMVISSDIVRKRLLGMKPSERAKEEYRRGIYARDVTDRTYKALMDEARPLLLVGKHVILDAAFLHRRYRGLARRLARETGAQLACLEVTAPQREVRVRLDQRVASGKGPSDGRWDIYLTQKRRYQPPTEIETNRRVQINTSNPAETHLPPALQVLRTLSPLSLAGPTRRTRTTSHPAHPEVLEGSIPHASEV